MKGLLYDVLSYAIAAALLTWWIAKAFYRRAKVGSILFIFVCIITLLIAIVMLIK